MSYVDGFVLPVPKKNIKAYKTLAKKASKVWMDHGALEYRECAADDMNATFCMSFPKLVKPKSNETVFFSFIVYKSRAHRDKVNKAVMADPRLNQMCDPNKMPFDCKRMVYGGFKVLVEG